MSHYRYRRKSAKTHLMFATHAAVFWVMFFLACFSIFGSLLCGPIQRLGYLIPLAVSPRPQNACELASIGKPPGQIF